MNSLKEDFDDYGPRPVNEKIINDELINALASKLKLDLKRVVPDELKIGVIEELDKMATYTTKSMSQEKLVKAIMAAYENLLEIPQFYSDPPSQRPDGHVLAGNQLAPYHYRSQRESYIKYRPLLLREVYSYELSEGRKFLNINQFKKLHDPLEQRLFLDKNGDLIGEGSSRAAYLINSRQVLKFATSNKGLGQNEAEVELFTNPKVKPFIAKIYDYDKNYHWLISELVRPLKDEEEFEKLTGVNWNDFEDLTYKNMGILVAKYENNEFVKRYIEMIAKTELMAGDLPIPDHWGRTNDNRVVLLDYGFTRSVQKKHYTQNPGATKKVSPVPVSNNTFFKS